MYINDLCQVSEFCLPLLFADDTKLNDDLKRYSEWLCCNALYLNVSKTHYLEFSPRSRNISNSDVRINNTATGRDCDTKFRGVQIDAQLSWKKHIEYTCNKLSKSVGIILKDRKKLHKAAVVTLYYSFAYPYIIYCNLVWRNTYSTSLKKKQSFAENPCENYCQFTIQSTYCAFVASKQTAIFNRSQQPMEYFQPYFLNILKETEMFLNVIHGRQMICGYYLQNLMCVHLV